MTYTVTDRDGNPVTEGTIITDFRGDEGRFVAVTRPPIPGMSGKVLVKTSEGRPVEHYHTVWGLTITVYEP